MKKNIVAYSLWGDNIIYWKGALENIKQVHNYFPGWICKFYIDKNCNNDLIKKGIRCCYFDFNYVQRFDFFERIYRDIT